MSTLIEPILVWAGALSLLKIADCYLGQSQYGIALLMVLVLGATLPSLLRGERNQLDLFKIPRKGTAFAILFLVCMVTFFLTALGGWAAVHFAGMLPIVPTVNEGQWPSWIAYQFLYIALAEEVFFRGFLLSSFLRYFKKRSITKPSIAIWLSILASSFLFALSHIVITGSLLSGLTLFPGIIMGWLFVKTRSLTIPILYHGLANVFYAILGLGLAG